MSDKPSHRMADTTPRTLYQFLRRLAFVLAVAASAAILTGVVLPPIFDFFDLPTGVSHALYIVVSIAIFTVVTQRYDDQARATRGRG